MIEPNSKDPINNTASQSNLHLIFLGLLSVSFIGFFVFRSSWIGVILGHTAGLSIMVFYGGLAGTLVQRKGYKYFNGFKVGFFIPISLGIISTFILSFTNNKGFQLACGGWTALATGIFVIIISLLLKRKNTDGEIKA